MEEGAPGPFVGAVAAGADTIANCVSDIQDFNRSTARSKTPKADEESVEEDEKEDPYRIKKARPSKAKAVGRLTKELAAEVAVGKFACAGCV